MNCIKKRVRLYQIYNCILVIGATSLFGFSNRITSLYYSDFMCLFVFISSLFVLFLMRFRLERSDFVLENVLYIAMIVAGIIVAMNTFYQTLYDTLKEALFPATSLLAYYIIVALYNNKQKVESLKNAIVIGSSISSIVSIIASLLLLMGIDILNIGIYLKERNGLPRFAYGTTLILIGFFISYVELKYGKRYKKKYVINIILNAINIIFVIQTRTLIVYILLTIVALNVIFSKRKKKRFKIIVLTLIVLFGFLVNASEYLALNTQIYNESAGIRVRFEAINHYMKYFSEYPLFGVGFLTVGDNPNINYVINGYGHYNISDVGIFGFIMTNGMLGLIWLILWFRKIIKIYVHKYKIAEVKQSTLVLILIIYTFLSLINLMFNAHPIFLNMPLYMMLTQALVYYDINSLNGIFRKS